MRVAEDEMHQKPPKREVGAFLPARPNPSIERTCPGKPGHASHVKR